MPLRMLLRNRKANHQEVRKKHRTFGLKCSAKLYVAIVLVVELNNLKKRLRTGCSWGVDNRKPSVEPVV